MSKDDRKRRRHKGRSGGGYLGIPHSILRSQEFGELCGWDVKLLIELAGNFNGKNNGDLSAAYSVLARRGWRSTGTLSGSLERLLKAGWLLKTRHGGRNRCALYAVTWWPVDPCEGKWLEIQAESVPRHSWKKTESLPAIRSSVPAIRSSDTREAGA